MLTKTHVLTLRRSDPTHRLSKAIELAGVTQREVARALGMTESYISALSRNTRGNPTLETLHKFKDFFQCRIEDLFPSEEERRQPAPFSHEEYSQKSASALVDIAEYEADNPDTK